MNAITGTTMTDADSAGPPERSALATILAGAWTVLQFEFLKSRTWKRVLIWAGVSTFPGFIVFMMSMAGDELPRGAWISGVFMMCCEMVVILNAMLWIAPIVQTELEGKTWLYVVTRPYGRVCLVLGKMLNGLVWTLGAGLLALALVGAVGWMKALPLEEITGNEVVESREPAPPVKEEGVRRKRFELAKALEKKGRIIYGKDVRPEPDLFDGEVRDSKAIFTSLGDALRVGAKLAGLVVLSSLAYASLFCGIGCLIPKRAMLISFSYTLIFESVIAFVPAIINRVTIQYHLRCLLNSWIDLKVPKEGRDLFFSNWPAWWHLAVLAGMIVVWQVISLSVIRSKQYVMTDDS